MELIRNECAWRLQSAALEKRATWPLITVGPSICINPKILSTMESTAELFAGYLAVLCCVDGINETAALALALSGHNLSH